MVRDVDVDANIADDDDDFLDAPTAGAGACRFWDDDLDAPATALDGADEGVRNFLSAVIADATAAATAAAAAAAAVAAAVLANLEVAVVAGD